jgi:4-hydroxythreonine-4-phosphate dehydrogenase
MINVTQGSENSISLEIYLKSILGLSTKKAENFKLFVSKESLHKNLDILKLNATFTADGITINNQFLKCHFIQKTDQSTGLQSIISATEKTGPDDILFTLPLSKDQLQLRSGVTPLGHTEYFREIYQDPFIPMFFKSGQSNLLLVTDHIPLKEVPNTIDKDLIFHKTTTTIQGLRNYFKPVKNVYFSGVNPHSGEAGLLGDEEKEVTSAINRLSEHFDRTINFHGPMPGDTLHHIENCEETLKVYMYHDQGLSYFKSLTGYYGVNITFGLPFLRLSVDHGTAPDIAYKNKANIQGALYTMEMALQVHSQIKRI